MDKKSEIFDSSFEYYDDDSFEEINQSNAFSSRIETEAATSPKVSSAVVNTDLLKTPERVADSLNPFMATPSTDKIPLSPTVFNRFTIENSPIIKEGNIIPSSQRPRSNEYRTIYSSFVGPIGKNEDVHHIDHSSSNSNPDNLVAIEQNLHRRVHQCHSSYKRLLKKDDFSKKFSKFINGSRDKKLRRTIKRTYRDIISFGAVKSSLKNSISNRDSLVSKRESSVGIEFFNLSRQ